MASMTGGQWAILPAMVRYDPKLPPNAKLIYAEIAAKINEDGYCFAHNQYFSERFNIKPDTVSSLVKRLADAGYIELDLSLQRGNLDKRRIYLTCKPYDFTGKASSEGIGFKSGTGKASSEGIGFKSGTGKISERVSDLNPVPIDNGSLKTNNPPISPPEGGNAPPKRRKTATQPDWEPEIFERFWKAYPRGEGKQAAKRAWNRLKPDAVLRRTMALALKAQLDTPDYNGGIFPHASTWLNGSRWTDELDKAAPVADAPQQERRYADW